MTKPNVWHHSNAHRDSISTAHNATLHVPLEHMLPILAQSASDPAQLEHTSIIIGATPLVGRPTTPTMHA